MKKKKRKIRWELIILGVLILFAFFFFSNLKEDCWRSEIKCYKTECSFWGCGKVEVDLDSPQCETKEDVCVSGTFDFG